MLELIGSLEDFSYINESMIQDVDDELELFHIQTALLHYAKASLKSLAIIRPFAYDKPPRRFDEFQALKHLECEEQLLIEHMGDVNLQDQLASSVETITLYDRRCGRRYESELVDRVGEETWDSRGESCLRNSKALTLKQSGCKTLDAPPCRGCKDTFSVEDINSHATFKLSVSDCR